MSKKSRQQKQQRAKSRYNDILATKNCCDRKGPTKTDRSKINITEDRLIFEPSVSCNNSTGDFLSTSQGDFLLFLGQDQQFLKDLTEIVNNSHTTRAIIDAKSKMVLGDGFAVAESKHTPILSIFKKAIKALTSANTNVEELNNTLANCNVHGDSLEDVVCAAVWDYLAFGNTFVELIRGTKDGLPYVYCNNIPLKNVALEKRSTDTNKIEYIGLNCDWSNTSNDIVKIPMYPKFENVNGVERSVIHIKNFATGFDYWGLPSNIAGRFWALIECLIPKYNIGEFKNGFKPSALVQFFGRVSKEKADGIVNNFVEHFTGEGKNGKVMAQVLTDPKYAANVQTFNDTSEGKFIDLQQLTTQGIIQANNWSTSLSGIATGGKLGQNQQMAYELDYINTWIIEPIRRLFLSKLINPFISENSKLRGDIFKDYAINIVNVKPIGISAQIDINTALTIDEQRQVLGYDPLENSDNGN